MMLAASPLIYTVGLDPLTARAVRSDLAGAVIRRQRPVTAGGPHSRGGSRPDLLLIDLSHVDVQAELAAARAPWGEDIVVVGLERNAPLVRVWRGRNLAATAEIGPGFLQPFLRWGRCCA